MNLHSRNNLTSKTHLVSHRQKNKAIMVSPNHTIEVIKFQ